MERHGVFFVMQSFKSSPVVATNQVFASTPVPLKDNTSGDEVALLEIETEPLLAPTESGEKATLKVQVAAGTIICPLHKSGFKVNSPRVVSGSITRSAVPVLVTVTVWVLLMAPIA